MARLTPEQQRKAYRTAIHQRLHDRDRVPLPEPEKPLTLKQLRDRARCEQWRTRYCRHKLGQFDESIDDVDAPEYDGEPSPSFAERTEGVKPR